MELASCCATWMSSNKAVAGANAVVSCLTYSACSISMVSAGCFSESLCLPLHQHAYAVRCAKCGRCRLTEPSVQQVLANKAVLSKVRGGAFARLLLHVLTNILSAAVLAGSMASNTQ